MSHVTALDFIDDPNVIDVFAHRCARAEFLSDGMMRFWNVVEREAPGGKVYVLVSRLMFPVNGVMAKWRMVSNMLNADRPTMPQWVLIPSIRH